VPELRLRVAVAQHQEKEHVDVKNVPWKKIAWGVVAAFTTPSAIKSEKSIAATALTRFAVLVPSAAWAVDLLLKALGA
jgi:hypothetical protein